MPRRIDPLALDRFIAELCRTGRLARAIAASGVSRAGLFKRRARDPAFARRWAEALAAHRRQRPQDRRRITPAAERTFLAALMWGTSVREAAAEAGFTHPSFYARARRDPRFAALMGEALDIGEARRLIRYHRMDWTEEEREADLDAITPADFLPAHLDALSALLQRHYHRKGGKLQLYWDRYRAQHARPIEEVRESILRKIDAIQRLDRWQKTGKWLG